MSGFVRQMAEWFGAAGYAMIVMFGIGAGLIVFGVCMYIVLCALFGEEKEDERCRE